MKDQNINIETVIIGGGFSGLFMADSFIKSEYDSFLLLERYKSAMGGYAVCGGIKVGLLPAGEETKNILQIDSYNHYENSFIQFYKKYLVKPKTKPLNLKFDQTPFSNKYYYSYILPRVNAKKLITDLYARIGEKILFSTVRNIVKNSSNSYNIHLENKIVITCKNIINAAGRNYPTMLLLRAIGQKFIDRRNLLFGCRVTFDSESAKYLYNYQPDRAGLEKLDRCISEEDAL